MKRRLPIIALAALTGAVNAQVLTIHSPSLTTYQPSSASAVQDIRPLAIARGVGVDGSIRAGSVQGWSLAANPFGDHAPATARVGDVSLATGTYMPTEVDIALPQAGMVRWVIGRSFNGRQETSTPAHRDSNGYQGYNWFQMSQPAIVFYDGDPDMVYIVYGADRFLEFKDDEAEDIVPQYVGVNGTAGVITYIEGSESDPDQYVYYDQQGVATHFLGGTNSGAAAWQIWKIVDPAGNTAYVGDATDKVAAKNNGYTADGAIAKAYDAAGRRYCYSYSGSTIGGVKRLEQVLVETDAGGGWGDCGAETMVAKVNYTYYSSDVSGEGKTGDLKLVKITTPLTDSGVVQEREQYYRYYTASYTNSNSLRGEPHQIKLVVGPEGTRKFDWGEDGEEDPPALDDGFLTATDDDLKSYAQAYLEYHDTGGSFPYRVYKAFFNGECGCGGGGASNGVSEFTYGTNGSFSEIGGYDTEWKERVAVKQPDTYWATQYFDECGQPISKVMTNTDPSGSPSKTWATQVVRNASGQVIEIHTPANNDTYTHSTGAFVPLADDGLVHVIDRVSGGNLAGYPEAVRFKEGNSPASGDATFVSWTSYASRDLVVGAASVWRPVVTARRAYFGTADDYDDAGTYDETTMSYSWWSGTSTSVLYIAMKDATTTYPAVDDTKNGSDSATSAKRFLRQDGTTAFALAADGIYNYTQFTNGQLTKQIADVDTSGSFASGDDPNTDWGITESGDGWNRVSQYSYDAQGRPDTMTEPDGRVHKSYYSKIGDGRNVSINWPRLDSATLYGPASYSISNHSGGNEVSGLIAITASGLTLASHPLTDWITESDADPITALDKGTLSRLSVNIRSQSGAQVNESRVYFDIPASGDGSSSNYDVTTFTYDDMGRRYRTIDPTGTITRSAFDELGRVVSTSIGTNDNLIEDSDNMVQTSASVYDGGNDGGNSHLTSRTLYVEGSSTGQRVTTYEYDFRGRVLLTLNPVAPHAVNKYDNLGRATATAQYSASVASSTDPAHNGTQTYRVALSKMFYDELGRVYKSERWKIDQADGSDDDSIASNTWRDAAGRVIKVQGGQFEKSAYDRLGRVTKRFILAKSNDTGYGDADDVSGDHLLEEHQTVYESAHSDNVLMTVALSEIHNVSSGTGPLDSDADNDPLMVTAANLTGRAQITAMWHDSLDRVIDTVHYGTYGSSDFDRDGLSVPTRSDTALRTTTVYNDDGTVLSVEAPGKPSAPTGTSGTITRYEYDDLGRQTKVINNYADGTPGGGTNSDEDQTIKYEFAKGLMTKMIADLSGTDQETLYIYGSTAGTPAAMKITTGNLLRAVKYPDSGSAGTDLEDIDSDSSDVQSFAYNAQGQKTYEKDQAGTIIETVFDTLGRETDRKVRGYGSGIDQAVERISTVYLSRGLPDTVTQYDDPDSGSALDQVQYSYDDWGNLTQFNQDVDSAIGVSGRAAFNVGYTYAKATGGAAAGRPSAGRP